MTSLPLRRFGVFDGHGGRHTAHFVKNQFAYEIAQALEQECENADGGAVCHPGEDSGSPSSVNFAGQFTFAVGLRAWSPTSNLDARSLQ